MFLTIADVLDNEALAEVRTLAARLSWVSGSRTAGAVAREVKKNLQADLTSKAGEAVREIVGAKVRGHPVVNAYARPSRWSDMLMSRTEVGGGYGTHIDNPSMNSQAGRIRTDLSYTLFLSEPEDYEGGELVVDLAGVTHAIKGNAGDLVIYPSTTLHHVAEVTSGARYVCVGWIESRVRRADQREIMFDLENLKSELASRSCLNSPEGIILQKTLANLTRMWGE